MKVLVIGASGRVGKQLTKRLLEDRHTVFGTSRHQELLFRSQDYRQIELDLSDSLEQIKRTLPIGLDAIYFVSGSRGKDLLSVDLDGAIKTMIAAEAIGADRYIMLSTILSLAPERWTEFKALGFGNYYIAKHYADKWLINNTSLNYSILQPGHLKEKLGTGKISVNVDTIGDNTIADVAHTLAELLENSSSFKKVISMREGETPINLAISEM